MRGNGLRRGDLSAGEVRADFIHTHSVVLQALARTGRELIQRYPKQWPKKLSPLKKLDWRRANSELWEGRALVGGQLSKAHHNVVLTANAIKQHLGLTLNSEEQRVEDAFNGGNHGSEKEVA